MKTIIIGAVGGGGSVAARLRRNDEHQEIVLIEKGAFVSYANCGLPYYIGDVIKDREKLFVQTASGFRERFNIDVRTQQEVLAIDSVAKQVTIINLITSETYVEKYDKLVLSPGAAPIRPPLSGIELPGIYTLRNVQDTDKIKAAVKSNNIKHAVIVGAGFIGLEMAENLHHLGLQTHVIEAAPQILAPLDADMAAIAQQELTNRNIDVTLNDSVESFTRDGQTIFVNLKSGKTIETQVVILSIGVKPDVKLAQSAGIELGAFNGIKVNEYLQTSNSDIYAIGDAIEFTHPISGIRMPIYLAGPANKQGRIAANNIAFGNHEKWHGASGTAIVKLFDLTIAVSGLASKHLEKANIQYTTSTTHNNSHASYYPDAKSMTIRLLFDPFNGRLLGGQIIGQEGVDKRIEMISESMRRNGNISDLSLWEHAYAPPYSSAKDPINIAGFVAENILHKRMIPFYTCNEIGETDLLIDVRTTKEYSNGSIPNSINIPIDELREHLNELKDKRVFVYCEVGQRGYIAQRILMQYGIESYNLSGGYKLWKYYEKYKCKRQEEIVL